MSLKSDGECRLLWEDAGSAAQGAIKMTPSDTEPMRFFTSGVASSDEKMRITSSGNVGIGTTSPDELLTIEGAGNEFIRVVGGGSGDAAAGIKLETTSGSNRPSGVYMFSDVAENTWYMGRKYSADEWCVARKGSTSSTDESTADGANALLTVATDGAVDLID